MKNIQGINQKRCKICGSFFKPDPRVGKRQCTCGKPACQRELKIRRDHKWRQENPDYFKGRYEETFQWRKANPLYQKERRKHEIQVKIGRGKGINRSFVALGFEVKAQSGEIQVKIPPGISVKRDFSVYGSAGISV